MRPKIAVIGAGAWGTTLASMCARRGPTVLWAREAEVVQEINERHRNTLYLSGCEVPRRLRATGFLEDALDGADVVVMAVPSSFFRAVFREVAPLLRPAVPVVSVAKGFESGSLMGMTAVMEEFRPEGTGAVLSGPNLAREIMAGYAAGAVLACRDTATAEHLQGVFNSGLYRVYTSPDVVGVEAAGALKNVVAIASGMADGAGVGDNTRALVITRGLAELTRLGIAMGGDPRTFAGLAGLGDLLATCMSPLSRNRSVGEQLGRGRKLGEIVAEMHAVAEGVHTCKVVLALGRRHGVPVPIAQEIHRVLYEGVTAVEAYRRLVRRPPGSETD